MTILRATPQHAPKHAAKTLRTSAVDRAPAATRWGWLDLAVVMAVIVIAYLPYLVGAVNTGVLGFNSGLATIPLGPWLGLHSGLPWLDPNVGYVSQALGRLSAVDLLHGHLPWWNPLEAVGVPLAGEGQSAALFPLTILLALSNGQLLFHLALQLIAGVATQRLLREMGMARWVTVVGGILFGLNGTFAWLTNAPFNPVAFLPLILWGIERCRKRSFREGWSGWLLIALGISLSVYSGFPETAYIDGLLALVWAVLRLCQQPAGRRAGFAATAGIGGAVGLLVSAPFFAAFSSATKQADIGGHAGGFATAHLPLQAVNTLGLPYLYGPLDAFTGKTAQGSLTGMWGSEGGFVTAAVLALALYGLFAGRDRGLRWLLAGWVAVTLTKSFGVAVVMHVLNLLPGMSAIAFYRYAPPSWELAFVLLAALGLQSIGEGAAAPSRRTVTALGLAAATTLVAVGAELLAADGLLSSLDRHSGFSGTPVAAVVWAIATVAILVVVGWAARPALARWAIGMVLVIEGLVMFMVPDLSAPTQAIPVDLRPVTYLQHHLGLSRFVTLGPIVPNYGSYFGIAEANAHDLPIPGSWATFVHMHLEQNELPQQFNGVTSTNPKDPTPVQELERNLVAYEAIGVKYVVAPSEWGDLPGHIVFRDRYVHIWELPASAPFFWVLSGACTLHPVSYDQVRADCSEPSEVVRSELAAPGWTATVNGRPAAMDRTGPLFSLVHLGAGTSEVSFTYLPPQMGLASRLAAGGGALALVAAVGPAVLRRRRKSRARRAAARYRASGPYVVPPIAYPLPTNGSAKHAVVTNGVGTNGAGKHAVVTNGVGTNGAGKHAVVTNGVGTNGAGKHAVVTNGVGTNGAGKHAVVTNGVGTNGAGKHAVVTNGVGTNGAGKHAVVTNGVGTNGSAEGDRAAGRVRLR